MKKGLTMSRAFVGATPGMLLWSAVALAASARPSGPCDIYGKAGNQCVAAHSTVRALYATYNGPLYQVKRLVDGKTLDIGVVQPSGSDAGGYADARAQDAFCAKALCVIQKIYDQSGKGNDLLQAAPGTFKGPAKGGFNTLPIADMAPITISGHKAYGVYIMPGMGFRNNNARGIAIGDEAEGIYYVIDGTHYDSGCCFDYGNSSTNGRAVGTGTMETVYFGTSTAWGKGSGRGPWIMSDMEAGLFSGHGPKENANDPTIDSWRFVTAVMEGGDGDQWDLRGGNAQRGTLTTFYRGERPAAQQEGGYSPMRKQGGILLGTGGDNGNGSSGTFYEGVMTRGFPSEATTDAVQANIVAARYDVPRLELSRLTSFTPGSEHSATVSFTNTSGEPLTGVRLSLHAPDGTWKVLPADTGKASEQITNALNPASRTSVVFRVTSPAETVSGFLTAKAEWTGPSGAAQSDTVAVRVRNAPAVKINEVRLGVSADLSDQFVELYNASTRPVDLSGWTLVSTQSQWAPVTLAIIPKGASLAANSYYLLGLSNSGLAAPASAGAATIYVWNADGFAAGQKIDVDGEERTIAGVGTKAESKTIVFVPVSTGPLLTVPAGSSNLPVASAGGFKTGEKIGIDAGGNYEMATVTAVGEAATQAMLAASAPAGTSSIRLAEEHLESINLSPGDVLTIGTGDRIEMASVARVGAKGPGEFEVELTASLRADHAAGVDVSSPGTGISFSPATRFPHASGDAVQALGSGIMLDHPLIRAHSDGAPVLNARGAQAGYRGDRAPGQWFGSMLSPSAGSLALMDASGAVVVDAVVYGSQQSNSSGNGTIASPELATLEGEQGAGGCIATISRPEGGTGFSIFRYPDGADTDANCRDFHVQSAATLAMASAIGATNLKVTNVEHFTAGQTISIDSGANAETATITSVGTPGATTSKSATEVAATLIPVLNAFVFRPGQTIVVGEGAVQETAVVLGFGGRGIMALTVEVPLKFAHAAGTSLTGSGISLNSALGRAHAAGAQIHDHAPTPGASNLYEVR